MLEGYNAVDGYKITKGNLNLVSNRHYRKEVGCIDEEMLPAGRRVGVDFEGSI